MCIRDRYHKTKKTEIITFDGAFHGRTYGALSAQKNKNYSNGFGHMHKGFKQIEFNNKKKLMSAVNKKTAGIIIEPIQGEGGIRPANLSFLKLLRKICNEKKILLFFDEVQCGFGRSGKLFSHEWANIKPDIIEASVWSHAGDNLLDLYAKTILIHKYKNKGIGLNAISSYKRASNILDKAGKRITGRPDAVLFRKDEEKILHEKINEIRKAFTVKDDNKDYESLLIKLSDTKVSTDNFFDKVVVNDENQDIKNNRLELLKMYCNTFDNFIDFSPAFNKIFILNFETKENIKFSKKILIL